MVRRVLFETRVGDWFLGLVERWLGLGVVAVEDLDGLRVRVVSKV